VENSQWTCCFNISDYGFFLFIMIIFVSPVVKGLSLNFMMPLVKGLSLKLF
jgi:hypothetical protein